MTQHLRRLAPRACCFEQSEKPEEMDSMPVTNPFAEGPFSPLGVLWWNLAFLDVRRFVPVGDC